MIEDGLWLIFLFKERVLVPTMARTEAGFYLGIDPVEVVDADHRAAVEQAIIRVVKRGNPIVPTPSRARFPRSPLLKHAKMKSISSFDKIAKCWKFKKREGAFLIVPCRPRKDSGQEDDTERGEALPAGVGLETAVCRLISRALQSK